MIKHTRVIHPFLLSIYPVLFLFSYNFHQNNSPRIIILPLLTSLILSSLVWLLFYLAVKDRIKSGLIISLLLILFFSYGHVQKPFWGHRFSVFDLSIGRNLLLFPIWTLIAIIGSIYLIKEKKVSGILNHFFNVLAILLVGISLFALSIKVFSSEDQRNLILHSGEEALTISRPQEFRDIYYIIFDRYADHSTLKEIYGFDNFQFYDQLRNRGFFVCDSSRSNYPRTLLSLASSLNMTYLTHLREQYGRQSQDYKPIIKIVENYRVWQLLKSLGYRYVHIGSWYQNTSRNRYADLNLYNSNLTEFSFTLLQTTMVYPLLIKFGILSDLQHHAKVSLDQFVKVAKVPRMKQPTYTFAHFLLPHAPYSFDRHGNILPDVYGIDQQGEQRYLEQLLFVNKKIISMIDTILSNSDPQPIIIIQSDEGSFPRRAQNDFLGFNWEQADAAELKQKTGILNAYLFPTMPDSLLSHAMTPVNSFRLLFNYYFETNMPLYPDSIFVISNEKYAFDYYDITDRLQKSQKGSHRLVD